MPVSVRADDAAQGAAASSQQGEITLRSMNVKANLEADQNGYTARSSNSAVGFDLSRRETPQSISVIDRKMIDDFALTGVNELLDLAPGVNVERVETDRTYYTARGFDVQTFQFDGIGMPFSNGSQWGDLDTAVYERVDVLRGANGLLTSTGNPSATVNFIRKRPTADFQASISATVGSWNQKRVDGDVSGPLTNSGNVRGRLVLVKENSDSYLDRYGVDKTVASGDVDIDIGSATVLKLGYTDQRKDADSPLWGALPLTYADGSRTHYDTSTSTSADWSYWNNKDRSAYAELMHDLGGDWVAQTSLLYRKLDGDSALLYLSGAPDKTTGGGLYAFPSEFDGNYKQTLADLRVSGPFDLAGRSHELLAGVNWSHEKAHEHSEDASDYQATVGDISDWGGNYPKPAFDIDGDGSSWLTIRRSAYGAVRLNPADSTKVILGANWTQIHSSGVNYSTPHSYSRTKTTPYVGIVQDLNDTISAYASYTRIFNPQTEVDVNNKPLEPIEGSNLEGGFKSEWLNKRLLGSIAIFRAQQKHTAETAGTFPNGDSYYKGVNATSTGFETELAGKLTDNWDINASYTQFRLVDDDGHNARVFVPRDLFKLATSVKVPAIPALKIGGALKYHSETSNEDGDFVVRQGGYTTVDLMANYEFNPHFDLGLNIDNITDKKYLTSLYWDQSYYAEPRSVSATLRWTF
jgi:outer membrane receptor for ferric coprogen and ferric-rhodotorulic acid